MGYEEHIDIVEQNYRVNKNFYRDEFKEAILSHKILKGMWPTEALLAGGGAAFKVKPDETVWQRGTDPMIVMRAQCLKPDNSEIEMSLQNCYQFDSVSPRRFVVCFKHGIVESIREI